MVHHPRRERAGTSRGSPAAIHAVDEQRHAPRAPRRYLDARDRTLPAGGAAAGTGVRRTPAGPGPDRPARAAGRTVHGPAAPRPGRARGGPLLLRRRRAVPGAVHGGHAVPRRVGIPRPRPRCPVPSPGPGPAPTLPRAAPAARAVRREPAPRRGAWRGRGPRAAAGRARPLAPRGDAGSRGGAVVA